jgi:hypothetical protein
MARLRQLLQHVCGLLLLLLAVGSHALKFEIQAGNGHDKASRRCIRNFVSKDMLVVVTAITDGYRGDGMQLNMHVSGRVEGTPEHGLTLPDPRLDRQRVRQAQGHCRRAARRLYRPCRRPL